MSTGVHEAKDENGRSFSLRIDNLPDECPRCNTKGTFPFLYLAFNTKTHELEASFRCPNSKCHKLFIGRYTQKSGGGYTLSQTQPKSHNPHKFPVTINLISSQFEEIYNQALQAEEEDLEEICGPGYRKALEFLIKDYLISKQSDPEEIKKIKQEYLGTAIANRIPASNIKEVAKRAVWLGNDETHYTRRWEDKDLKDLKTLIQLTVDWVEMELLTAKLLQDMPDKSGAK